jgi:hypothetical protein
MRQCFFLFDVREKLANRSILWEKRNCWSVYNSFRRSFIKKKKKKRERKKEMLQLFSCISDLMTTKRTFPFDLGQENQQQNES